MKKRRLIFFLMLAVLVTSIAGDVDAQFWKKKSKRHKHKTEDATPANDSTSVAPVKDEKTERKDKKKKRKEDKKKKKQDRKEKKKQEKKAKAAKKKGGTTPVVVVKKPEEKVAVLPTKNRYRVDVLASLYLDELVKGGAVTFKDKIPDKAIPGVAFYAGVNIAADSLKKEGLNIDIYVHDITSFLESPERLTSLGGLDSSDLIIGAVQSADIPMFADYAKKNSVNFISTTSASDGGVHDNLYFTMMQPTLKTHCEWIVEDIKKKFPGQKVSLLYQTKGLAENNAYTYITDAPAGNIHYKYLSCNTMPKKENFNMVVDLGKPNIFIVSILDIRFADSLLHELAADYPGTHFEIYGMPSWTSISGLRKAGIFPNLTVDITTPFTVDPASPAGEYVKKMYKKDYSGKISESVYRGYETIFWYANLLKQFGTHFTEKYTAPPPAPFTPLDIQAVRDKNNHILYYENKHIFLSTFEDGVYKVR